MRRQVQRGEVTIRGSVGACPWHSGGSLKIWLRTQEHHHPASSRVHTALGVKSPGWGFPSAWGWVGGIRIFWGCLSNINGGFGKHQSNVQVSQRSHLLREAGLSRAGIMCLLDTELCTTCRERLPQSQSKGLLNCFAKGRCSVNLCRLEVLQ